MRLCIKFEVAPPRGSRRTFVLYADRDFPAVPRPGDAVTPDEQGQLAPRDVRRVIYEPDGALTLELDPGLPTEDPEAFIMVLQTLGFDEVDAKHLP